MDDREQEIASTMPDNFDALPRLRGFRLRGLQMTRLETFIDAAFAFSVTMMVISVDRIPDTVNELLRAFTNVPAFLTSIIVLGIFWRGHWLWSRRYGLEDGVSILISWAMLATILIYIYPLRVVFGAMWYVLSNRHVGHPLLIHTVGDARALFAAYALGFTATASEILLLYVRAWRLREPLRLNARERLMTRGEIAGWSIPVGVGVLSFVLAMTLPVSLIAWSGWVYFSMAIVVPLHSWWRRRRLERAAAGR